MLDEVVLLLKWHCVKVNLLYPAIGPMIWAKAIVVEKENTINHRAPVQVDDDEHQNKHHTLIVVERFICLCNDHRCISEARTKRKQGKKFGQGNDMVFTFRFAIEPIVRVLAHLRGGEQRDRGYTPLRAKRMNVAIIQ
jgi:hypothetical protein